MILKADNFTGQDRTGQDRTGQDRTGQDSLIFGILQSFLGLCILVSGERHCVSLTGTFYM